MHAGRGVVRRALAPAGAGGHAQGEPPTAPDAIVPTPLRRAYGRVLRALRPLLAPVALALAIPAGAQPTARGTLRADTLWSRALGTRKQLLVWLPPSYGRDASRRYPVAYYLHGLWGSETDWTRQGRLDATLDSLTGAGLPEMIVVMPDGDDAWYTTWNTLGNAADCQRDSTRKEPAASYCVPWPHYDDYVAHEVVAHVDATYRTLAERRHRAIGGLSMGGYGAVTLALRYPEVFAAAASHSGVLAPLYVGPRPYAEPPRWATTIGTAAFTGPLAPSMLLAFGRDTLGWWARDPGRMARRLAARRGGPPMPALFVDVGRDDPFVDQSRAFHATLRSLGVSHEYAERPGAHTWDYWRTHARESLAWIAARIASPPTRP
jgi:putative tributyrin esterase